MVPDPNEHSAKGAVFVSYASQDAAWARELCAALRAAGVEVWFDRSELVGGDAWDAKIRGEIKDCALFVPIISANTQARLEGYFRIEWKLAAQRTHAMAAAKPFLLPVVMDATRDDEAHVPEEFRAVQWTRLAADGSMAAFARQVRHLLESPGTAAPFAAGSRPPLPLEPASVTQTLRMERTISFSPAKVGGLAVVVLLLGLGILALRNPTKTVVEPATQATPAPVSAPATPGSPDRVPAKSVAVLPFANLSDDKENEYFSDGISEEILNLLAKVPGLRVAARTSAFFFKDKQVPVAEIAQKLGVAYVVEGSVRKSGQRVRITAQLVKAADGFHVWSDNFDRELRDIFAVQDEIAGLVTRNLKLEMGVAGAARGAVNEKVYQLYLQGRHAWSLRTTAGLEQAERCFEEALALEPTFARAILGRADVWSIQGMERQEIVEYGQRDSPSQARIRAEIERALVLEPDSAEAYASLGNIHWLSWRVADAERALRRALALDANYATAHLWLGRVLQVDGRVDEALAEMRSATELDPLSSRTFDNYSNCLLLAGRVAEALAAAERAMTLQPDNLQASARQAVALAELGRGEEASAAARRLLAAVPMRIVEASYVLAKCGQTIEAEVALAFLRQANVRGVGKAYVLAALGRPEECLQELQSSALQANIVDYLYYFPVFDSVRADPRFAAAIAAVGMTEAHARAQAERQGWQRAKAGKK